jgi:acetyltransferase-like isoleucine patch superfamily enzyme
MKKLLQEQWAKIKAEKGWSAGHPLLPLYLLLRVFSLGWRWLRARITLRKTQSKGQLVFQNGRLKVSQQGTLHIGNRVRFWSTITTTHLRVGPKGKLEIGDDCFINGALLAAYSSIRIGRGVYLAPSAHITDSYAFGSPEAGEQAAPVWIKDNAWIATKAIILPGVTIGKGAVVGVGALVTTDVPDGAIVAGVPASVIRYLEEEEPIEEVISEDPTTIAHGLS